MFRFFESRIVAVKPDRRDYRNEHGHRDARSYPSDGGTNLIKPKKHQKPKATKATKVNKANKKSKKPQKTKATSNRRKWRFSKSCIIPALLLIASFASLIYPHAAMWLSQYRMSQVAAEYASLITHAVPAPHEQLRRAREYNSKLSSGAIYEANTNIPTSHGATSDVSQDYWDQLKVNDDGLMARLRIKKIDLDLPVYHGTEDATLLKGLGHLRGTSLPVGGKGTRSVITGHRGLASAEMFTRLDEVDKGDTFTIEVFDEILTYKVIDKIVVNPDETKKIAAVPGKDLVTLITCTPLGINTQRILVTGERVVPTPAADKALRGKKPDIPRFPWWIVWSVASFGIVCGYIYWAGLPVVKKKKKEDEANDDTAEFAVTSASVLTRQDQASLRYRSRMREARTAADGESGGVFDGSASIGDLFKQRGRLGSAGSAAQGAAGSAGSAAGRGKSGLASTSMALEDLESAEAQAIEQMPLKRPKAKSLKSKRLKSRSLKSKKLKSRSLKSNKSKSNASKDFAQKDFDAHFDGRIKASGKITRRKKREKTFDWLMDILGL